MDLNGLKSVKLNGNCKPSYILFVDVAYISPGPVKYVRFPVLRYSAVLKFN